MSFLDAENLSVNDLTHLHRHAIPNILFVRPATPEKWARIV